jgi:hypothetical protein
MPLKKSNVFDIVVSGGTGSIMLSGSQWGDGISIIAPTDPANYSFQAIDEDGHLLAVARNVKVKLMKVDTRFKIDGDCTFTITGADGTYEMKLFFR